MNKCYIWPISICSWSVDNDFKKIDHFMDTLEIQHVNLDLRPICIERSEEYLKQVQSRDWIISCTMIGFPQEDYSSLEAIRQTGGIVPDKYWPENEQFFASAIDTTKELGVKYLMSHIGFIDHKQVENYQKLIGRLRSLADIALAQGVVLLMETGQESAEDLKRFLLDLDHPAIGINFDPANMILYNKGNPIEALKILAPWVKHIHIKDATLTDTPGTWGSEVVWGTGQVGDEKFLDTLKNAQYKGAVAVEREAGESRVEDIQTAVKQLIQYQG